MSPTKSLGLGRRSLFSLSLRKGSGLSTTGQWLFQGHLGRYVRPARSTSHGDGPKSYWPDLIYSGSLHEQAHSVVAPRQPQAEPQRLKHHRNCHFCDLTPGQQMFRFAANSSAAAHSPRAACGIDANRAGSDSGIPSQTDPPSKYRMIMRHLEARTRDGNH